MYIGHVEVKRGGGLYNVHHARYMPQYCECPVGMCARKVHYNKLWGYCSILITRSVQALLVYTETRTLIASLNTGTTQ